jgi:hypothetical protein
MKVIVTEYRQGTPPQQTAFEGAYLDVIGVAMIEHYGPRSLADNPEPWTANYTAIEDGRRLWNLHETALERGDVGEAARLFDEYEALAGMDAGLIPRKFTYGEWLTWASRLADVPEKHIIIEDMPAGVLVAAGDIAKRTGYPADTIRRWANRHPEFRALAAETSAGLIWRWGDAERWLRETGRATKML